MNALLKRSVFVTLLVTAALAPLAARQALTETIPFDPAVRTGTLPNGVKYYVLDSVQGGQFDNVSGYKVPPGHYFMMGDNRDNSIDSRESPQRFGVGYVPYENLVGRAEIIFFSAAVDDPNAFRLSSPWTWPFDIRWRRIFSLVR